MFAIVITLLILDIRLPEVPYDELHASLHAVLPKILAYVMSFVVIGLYWVAHHHSFRFVHKLNGTLLWLNNLLLLIISFIPFPTSLLGRYPLQTLPLVLYGATLIAANATGFAMLLYLRLSPQFADGPFAQQHFKQQWPTYLWVNAAYLAAIALSFWMPLISYGIYLGMLAVLIKLYAKRMR